MKLLSRILPYILCILFASQGGMVAFAQQQQLSAIQSKTHGDTELICTGAQMKWISVSLTEELGRFVFVDGPDDVDQRMLENACPAGTMSDLQSAVAVISDAIVVSFSRFHALVRSLRQRPYTSFTYQTALSRAPPGL